MKIIALHNSALKWSYSDKKLTERIVFCISVFLFLVVIILSKLFFIWYSFRNNIVQERKVILFRNEISDRNGVKLAVNLPSTHLFAHPKQVTNKKLCAMLLSSCIKNVSCQYILSKLECGKNFVWLKKDLSQNEIAKIKSCALEGVFFEQASKRFYPYADLTAHFIGYTNADNIGMSGIEKGLEKEIIAANATRRDDKDIRSSLDIKLQYMVQEELMAFTNQFNAKGASCIVADIETGEIISYASVPTFNPNKIGSTDLSDLMNKCALGVYEFGSIIKPIIMSIGIDIGQVELKNIYDVTSLKVGKYNIKDYHNYSNNNYSTAQILSRSSNKGIAKIALAVGKDNIIEYMLKLGLFSKLPDIEFAEKAKPIYYPYVHWNNITLATLSYGYSLSITPLHYLQAMIPVVNNGKLIPLTLKKTDQPKYEKHIFKESTSEKMKLLLRFVVSDGTAWRMNIDGLEVGGKTGTAEKYAKHGYSKSKRISSAFAAFPMDKPKYIIHAMLDEPKGIVETGGYATGGVVVVPMIKNIILKVANLYGLQSQKSNLKDFRYLLSPPINENYCRKE